MICNPCLRGHHTACINPKLCGCDCDGRPPRLLDPNPLWPVDHAHCDDFREANARRHEAPYGFSADGRKLPQARIK